MSSDLVGNVHPAVREGEVPHTRTPSLGLEYFRRSRNGPHPEPSDGRRRGYRYERQGVQVDKNS